VLQGGREEKPRSSLLSFVPDLLSLTSQVIGLGKIKLGVVETVNMVTVAGVVVSVTAVVKVEEDDEC
jgi:hypothetical protein